MNPNLRLRLPKVLLSLLSVLPSAVYGTDEEIMVSRGLETQVNQTSEGNSQMNFCSALTASQIPTLANTTFFSINVKTSPSSHTSLLC